MKKYTAPAAAAMLLTALLTGGMTAHAEQQPPDLEAPDWGPSSFAEALDFDNTYGTVRIVDNAVCIVKPSDRYGTYRSEVVMTPDIPGNPDGGEPLSWHSTYHLELPEEPDQNDPDYKTKYQEYVELCAKLGISLFYGEIFAETCFSFGKNTVDFDTPDNGNFMNFTWSDSMAVGYALDFLQVMSAGIKYQIHFDDADKNKFKFFLGFSFGALRM